MRTAACSAGLPEEFDEYFDRPDAVGQICRLVPERRLLTVVGPAGIGKSRVALRVCRVLARDAFALAGWVRPAEQLDTGWIEQRVTQVRDSGRPLLLVVDDCEATTRICAALAALIAGYPDLHVLATSREALRLAGELVYPVTGLPLPPAAGGVPDLDVIWNAPSARLLLDRARSAGYPVPLTAGNAVACAAICRGLDGHPLAIELAGALTAALPLTDIADHLDQGLALFTRGYRTARPSHRGLPECLDSGVSPLSASARALLDCLGVFDGGFTLAAVEAVVAPVIEQHQERSLICTLTELVDRHLVARTRDRFRLAAPLRQYTRRNLRRAARWDDIAARHATWYGWLAESIGASLAEDRDDSATLALLDRESGNLATALRYGGSRASASAAIAEVLVRCWLRRDCERAYRMSGPRGLGQAPPRRGHDYLLARESLERRLTAEQRDGQPAAAARTRLHLGLLAVLDGDHRCGRAMLRAAASGHPAPQRRGDTALARCAIAISELLDQAPGERADAELAAAARLYRDAGNDNGIAFATSWRALAAIGRGDTVLARRYMAAAARLAAGNGDEFMAAALIGVHACVEIAAGRHCRALELAGAQTRAREQVSDDSFWLDRQLASSWRALGGKRAAEHWDRGLTMSFTEAIRSGTASPPRLDGRDVSVLSPRELEVARMVARGLSSVKIAQVFVISPRTVDTHIDHIRTKLGLHSRAELAAWVASVISAEEIEPAYGNQPMSRTR